MLTCMRTTLNLPDGLAEAAKKRAARDGRTLTSLIEEGLRAVLDDASAPATPPGLPSHGTGHGRVYVDLADREALAAELDRDGRR